MKKEDFDFSHSKKEKKSCLVIVTLLAFTDAVSVLVIMGCACCKQKKSAKEAAAADIADLSPSNAGGSSVALNQGRYCPDPTQTIPDFNKGFLSNSAFPNTKINPRSGAITGRAAPVCVCVCEKDEFAVPLNN